MFFACCALAFVFVLFPSFLLSLSLSAPLWAAAVGFMPANCTIDVNVLRLAMRFASIFTRAIYAAQLQYLFIYRNNYIAGSFNSILDFSVYRCFRCLRSHSVCSLRVWLSQSVVVYSRAAGRCLRCEAMNFS